MRYVKGNLEGPDVYYYKNGDCIRVNFYECFFKEWFEATFHPERYTTNELLYRNYTGLDRFTIGTISSYLITDLFGNHKLVTTVISKTLMERVLEIGELNARFYNTIIGRISSHRFSFRSISIRNEVDVLSIRNSLDREFRGLRMDLGDTLQHDLSEADKRALTEVRDFLKEIAYA